MRKVVRNERVSLGLRRVRDSDRMMVTHKRMIRARRRSLGGMEIGQSTDSDPERKFVCAKPMHTCVFCV